MSDLEIQRQYIDLLRRSGDAETYPAGETIFDQGDEADRMYVVDRGSVALQVGGLVVETVGPGGLFGEMAVVDRDPRSAAAVAETDSEVIGIDKRRFWFLVQETPFFAEIVMRVMASRLRQMNQALS